MSGPGLEYLKFQTELELVGNRATGRQHEKNKTVSTLRDQVGGLSELSGLDQKYDE